VIDDDDWERLLVAIELGEPARLRLRAEWLLKMGDRGEVLLTDAVRERLHRIAVGRPDFSRRLRPLPRGLSSDAKALELRFASV
jgi:hypothetical protein